MDNTQTQTVPLELPLRDLVWLHSFLNQERKPRPYTTPWLAAPPLTCSTKSMRR